MIDLKELIRQTIANKENAYAPYSHFRVSVSLVTKSGKVYKGVNIENASFSPTICGERSAIASAVSDGEKDFDIIIIAGDSDYTYPCGVCRQVMAEFFDEDTKIIIAKSEDDYKFYSLADLLPYGFGKDDLHV
ncbi:cytidine deaminase [Anaerococcus sp. AGMB09787]|uniref:cytidine deaminase n=1 Tax=Anaerococcus sp. AGMB09787 TaxID=2922869 RepID=UPI001FAEC90B|nr:cytidine deaminase [Anaerococcus sp. AGMB09787]